MEWKITDNSLTKIFMYYTQVSGARGWCYHNSYARYAGHQQSICAAIMSFRSSSFIRFVSFSIWSRYAHSFSIVLLTHANELRRPTNTGKLLLTHRPFDDAKSPGTTALLTWEGRGDNLKISDAVSLLSEPILIWTDAPKLLRQSDISTDCGNPTYIILDGTWQEAKKMFRQGPDCLRSIPRISLQPTFKSNYKLRGNFGYVNKFASVHANDSSDNVEKDIFSLPDADSNLLCTAEVGACLLLQHGYASCATTLLSDLESFQGSFQSYNNKKWLFANFGQYSVTTYHHPHVWAVQKIHHLQGYVTAYICAYPLFFRFGKSSLFMRIRMF